jgi:hypothetical protein
MSKVKVEDGNVYSRINIILGRIVLGITANVNGIRRLVYTDIIYPHRCREGEMLKVDITKVGGDTQVDKDVLEYNHKTTRE